VEQAVSPAFRSLGDFCHLLLSLPRTKSMASLFPPEGSTEPFELFTASYSPRPHRIAVVIFPGSGGVGGCIIDRGKPCPSQTFSSWMA